jgi:hypothetical protein
MSTKPRGRSGKVGNSIADNLPITVTTINGRQFVSGLLWEKLDRLRGFMSEARQRGRDLGMDIVAIRQLDLAAQAGFSPHRAGASKGQYSMAVVLAERYGNDFVAALLLDEGRYVFVACSEGIILPNCDLVVSREEAETKVGNIAAQLRRMVAGSKEKSGSRALRIVAPAEFGIPGSEERTLEVDLDTKQLKRHQQLKPLAFGISAKERQHLSIAAILVVVVGAGGYFLWSTHAAHRRSNELAQQREMAKEAALRLAGKSSVAGAQATLPKLPHPWLRQPPAALFIRTCTEQMGRLPPILMGWGFVGSQCGFGHMQVAYQRDPAGLATIADLQGVLKSRFGIEPLLQLSADGNTVTFPVGFRTPDFHSSDEVAPQEEPTVIALRSYFQRAGVVLDLSKDVQPAAAAGTPGKTNPAPVQDWSTYDITLQDTPIPPNLLSGLDMPTVRITSVSDTFNPITAAHTWTLKGALYVAQ